MASSEIANAHLVTAALGTVRLHVAKVSRLAQRADDLVHLLRGLDTGALADANVAKVMASARLQPIRDCRRVVWHGAILGV